MTLDQAEATLVRHLAPSIVQLPSGLFALCWHDRPTEFFSTLAEVRVPTHAELIEAHIARQRALRPPAKLGSTDDLNSLLGF